MRVLVAMSGGVDSSVAAALMVEQGHEVVGVTLKLWGGESDSGCCSVSDVDDARRVAQQLGIPFFVFNFTDDFDRMVVEPYVAAHAEGLTPNPCIECNRHLKFDRLLERARELGFDRLVTGHHAALVRRGGPGGPRHLSRGADRAKDQSYVLYMLGSEDLEMCEFPLGAMTKAEVRARAAAAGLRTAHKPDSQDVCFITSGQGRRDFLARRIEMTPAEVVDTSGNTVGRVDSIQSVTIGQRRGLGLVGLPGRRFVTEVDRAAARITVGTAEDLLAPEVELEGLEWTSEPVRGPVTAQVSAHGDARPARLVSVDRLRWESPQPRVAPGQAVVLYDGDVVVGGATAASARPA